MHRFKLGDMFSAIASTDFVYIATATVMILALSGCGGSSSDTSIASSCPALTGTPWVPSVSGASASNHNSSVKLTQSVLTSSGPIIGLNQGITSSVEIPVTIDMSQSLGALGSLTLIGETSGQSSQIAGDVFAFLVSLNDGTNEYIHMTSDCATNGLYLCSGGICSVNTNCDMDWTSSPNAYINRTKWEEHQGDLSSNFFEPSVNTFPTCNWTQGSGTSFAIPVCAFNSTFFTTVSGVSQLRSGVNYTAKYVLVANSYASVSSGYSAALKVTATAKTNTSANVGGAIDLNFILVGTNNINASRTTKGQQNLNTLATQVATYYSQTNANIKLGSVRSYELPCESGGDGFADATISQLGALLQKSGSVIPSAEATGSVNVFLVSSISDDTSGANSSFTILGVDGAINGPIENGTAVSGVVVSTFDSLDTYNPSCSSSVTTCPLSSYETDFYQLGVTVTHEMGHFLGLNHPSEYEGTEHDAIYDTPICTAQQSGLGFITVNSCLLNDTNQLASNGSKTCSADCPSSSYSTTTGSFCPSALSCEFNYVMWWTTKNFQEGSGNSDGNLFSVGQGKIMTYHPVVQ